MKTTITFHLSPEFAHEIALSKQQRAIESNLLRDVAHLKADIKHYSKLRDCDDIDPAALDTLIAAKTVQIANLTNQIGACNA